MADSRANGGVKDERAESAREAGNEESDAAVPSYGPWVSFYGFLHRSVRRERLVFGSVTAFGGFVLVRQFYAFVSTPSKWAGLPSWAVLVGSALFGFGVGYFVVRDDTSCPECDAAFSRELVARRQVSRRLRPEGPERLHVEETYECTNCGVRIAELYSHPRMNYPRH